MELNTMLCVGRSDLSGFNEGTTRRKLFTSASPTPDCCENVAIGMQQSPNASLCRSSILSTPPKKSILRAGQVVNSIQGSPSSLRSVRFSDDEDEFTVECKHIHVNESTQTIGMPSDTDDITKGTQTTHHSRPGARQSVRDSYIESVGSPKSPRGGSRSPSWTREQDEPRTSFNKSGSNKTFKSMQTAVQNVSDGRKIIQNMEVAPENVKVEKKPDGHKIIQNLELSKSKDKQVQTEEVPTFVSESTQTPVAPDGNRIIQNMDIEIPKSKHENTATQTPVIPDGSKIIQNMELDTTRVTDPIESTSRHAAVQTGTVSSTTQTPVIPDGSKITQNMDLLTPREDDSSFRSISIQTNSDLTGEQLNGQRIIQNMVLERIRSPSPDSMDCSFGFDVNVSFASTQTDVGSNAPVADTDIVQQEPVLIYNKSESGGRSLVINHNDFVGSNARTPESPKVATPQVATFDSNKTKLTKHSAKMLLERQTYSAQTEQQQTRQTRNSQTSSATLRNTQTASATFRNTHTSTSCGSTQTSSGTLRHTQTASGTLKSSQGTSSYKTSQTSIQEKLLSRSYTSGYQQRDTSECQRGIAGIPADKWIAPTIPTKLHSKSPLSPKRDTYTAPSRHAYSTNTPSVPLNPTHAETKSYMEQKSKFQPQMTSSVNDIPNVHCYKGMRQSSPVTRSSEHTATYTTQDTGKYRRESKLETFSRTAIDVYSFDPGSVEESKRLLSQSAYKESTTRNTFLKGINLPEPVSVTPRSVSSVTTPHSASSSYLTSTRPYSYDPYVQKVNLGRALPVSDRRFHVKEASYTSKYSNLKRARSAGSSSTSSHYTSSNYARSRSTSSTRVMPKPNKGYRSPNLTPALNQMRTSVIRKSSMNASTSSSAHASRPSSASSSGYSYQEQTKVDRNSSSMYSTEHRSRSRETTRGANSRFGQDIYHMQSMTHASDRSESPLYIENLTNASNARPRSKERYSKSKSPYTTDRNTSPSTYLGEHDRSRSSSATRTVSRKPPLPHAINRKQSPSPQRRSMETLQGQKHQINGHGRSSVPSPSRESPSRITKQSTNVSHDTTRRCAAQMSREMHNETIETADHDMSRVTIGKTPQGLVDKECVYLDERTIQRIIESANL